jgi:RNA polymerase sigma factor (sigma-70 family)
MASVSIERELRGKLLKQIARRTRDAADAEDLLHSAYVRMEGYSARNRVEDPPNFLIKTALNISIDHYRCRKDFAGMAEAAQVTDAAPLPDVVVAAKMRLRRVRDGLDRLPARMREVFLLHRLCNMKYAEIAHRVGVSASTVEKDTVKAAAFLTEWAREW